MNDSSSHGALDPVKRLILIALYWVNKEKYLTHNKK